MFSSFPLDKYAFSGNEGGERTAKGLVGEREKCVQRESARQREGSKFTSTVEISELWLLVPLWPRAGKCCSTLEHMCRRKVVNKRLRRGAAVCAKNKWDALQQCPCLEVRPASSIQMGRPSGQNVPPPEFAVHQESAYSRGQSGTQARKGASRSELLTG